MAKGSDSDTASASCSSKRENGSAASDGVSREADENSPLACPRCGGSFVEIVDSVQDHPHNFAAINQLEAERRSRAQAQALAREGALLQSLISQMGGFTPRVGARSMGGAGGAGHAGEGGGGGEISDEGGSSYTTRTSGPVNVGGMATAAQGSNPVQGTGAAASPMNGDVRMLLGGNLSSAIASIVSQISAGQSQMGLGRANAGGQGLQLHVIQTGGAGGGGAVGVQELERSV